MEIHLNWQFRKLNTTITDAVLPLGIILYYKFDDTNKKETIIKTII